MFFFPSLHLFYRWLFSQREKELDEQLMERFLFLGVKSCKERIVHPLSRLSNLLQFPKTFSCQFHHVASSVSWISLSLDKPSLLESIKQGHHVGAINRKLLRQLLLGCLTNSFKKQQNPIVRGLQFPGTEDLRKLTARFPSQAA